LKKKRCVVFTLLPQRWLQVILGICREHCYTNRLTYIL
jgi:hypothetical protein